MDRPHPEQFAAAFQPVIGAPVSMRPLSAQDFEIEDAFVRGLSAETRSRRLLGGARKITPEYIARLTQLDYPREFALAAVVMLDGHETLIGVARYALDRADGSYEFAIVVGDAWQGHGIGKWMLENLIEAARAHGIAHLKGYVHRANSSMLGLARTLGFRLASEPSDAALMLVTLELAEPH